MFQLFLANTKIALVAIWGNKIRSLLTILGVVIGVFAIITIIAIGSGLEDEIVGEISSLGADVIDIVPGEIGEGIGSAVGLQEKFKESDVQTLRKKSTLIKDITEMYQFAGTLKFNEQSMNSFVLGINPVYFSYRNKNAVAGRFINDDDNYQRADVAVLGYESATELFTNPEFSINQKVRINGKEFKVIGVMEQENLGFGGINFDRAVYLPALSTKKFFPDVGIMEIMARAKDENKINQAIKQTEIILQDVMGDRKFTVFGQETILDLVDNITGVITTALAGLASISLIVGGIGIMNIMLVSVTERTKEVGIRKAIGATNSHILVQFLTEAVVLCLVGGIVGLGAATVASAAITYFWDFPTLVNTETIIGAIGFSIFVGVIFGTAPALKAANKDPVESLRHE